MAQPEREFGSLSNAELSRRIGDTKRDIDANMRSYKVLAPGDGDGPGLVEAVRRYRVELIKLHDEVELRRGEPRRKEALVVRSEREFGSLSDAELSGQIADTKRYIAANRRSYEKLRPGDGDRPGLLAAVRRHEAELSGLHTEVELRRREPRLTEARVVRREREFGSLSDAELSRRTVETKRDITANTRSYEKLKDWDGDRPGLVEAVGRYEAELTRLCAEVELRRLES